MYPMPLLKRYRKASTKESLCTSFIQSLEDMAVESKSSNIFEYTKEWTEQVYRVGYFHLLNDTKIPTFYSSFIMIRAANMRTSFMG